MAAESSAYSILGAGPQIRQLREVFDCIDRTGDGSVDRAEFRRYMAQLQAHRPHLTLFNEAESIFSSLDRRKSGALCFADVRTQLPRSACLIHIAAL